MGTDAAENSLPIPQRIAFPQSGQQNLGGSKISSEIFKQFAKLGEQTYVFYVVDNNGKETKVPQSQLLQFLNSLKKETARSNLLRFFNSTNLARLSHLPQGYIHKINLNTAVSGGNPINEIEAPFKTQVALKPIAEEQKTPDVKAVPSLGNDDIVEIASNMDAMKRILEKLGYC